MSKLSGLRVIELLNASGVYLGTTPETRDKVVRSSLGVVPRPRELDDYHLCGVYHKAGVEVELEELLLDESITAKDTAYLELTRLVSDRVCQGLRDGKAVFVTGGTCVQAPGVAGGIRRAFGSTAKTGIIWLDAHGDLNIPATSPSGMLGGMPFATILGYGLSEWRQSCGLDPAFEDRYALLSDARSFDATEMDNIRDRELTIVGTSAFNDTDSWRLIASRLAEQVDTLYLHIDADIVDSLYLPSVNTPEPDGPDIWTLMENIRIVMETGKVSVASLASVYFDAQGRGKERNAENQTAILSGIRMIASIISNWQSWVKP